ncbi:unnamed protein product [Pseudo-nitzschia multistriata]|uniref:EamA domain-containing protein n=1 Tax=Pseudo-nitzschia multistriata TaxID=183589 RepID=A0A448ZHV0_9STRA|nr:unnamed protein product [Pseudo-nitzschia multistriata]
MPPNNKMIVIDSTHTESSPLLIKKDGNDQISIGTDKTYNSSEDFSAVGSDGFRPDPSSVVILLHRGNDNESERKDHNDGDHTKLKSNNCEEPLQKSLIEGLAEEFHDITEAALNEVYYVPDDENYMIEMGLTRNLSILHDDVVEASVLLQGSLLLTSEDNYDTEAGDDNCAERFVPGAVAAAVIVPLGAYLLLFSAIVAMSTIGPLLELQGDTTATMKVLWRMIGTSLLLAPRALIDIYRQAGVLRLTPPQWITFFLSTFWFVVMAIGFCLSLDYTSIGNAVILSNSQALMLLSGRMCTGAPVTMLEFTGAIVAFGGAVLCSRDAADTMDDDKDESIGFGTTITGDLLALASAIGGVGYVTLAKTSRAQMSLFVFMFLTMALGAVIVVLFQVAVLKEIVTWDRDVVHGVWGFLVWDRFDRLPLELVVVLICNLVGTMGYVRAMPHFDAIVICSVQLLEPTIAEFLSYFAGVGVLPGLLGWIGNAAVAGGTLVVVSESQKFHDASKKTSDVH